LNALPNAAAEMDEMPSLCANWIRAGSGVAPEARDADQFSSRLDRMYVVQLCPAFIGFMNTSSPFLRRGEDVYLRMILIRTVRWLAN
jgi:hypothetical protein